MNLEFLSIKVKNFRSYGNQFTEYNFYNGLDLITGTNGNGKTSLLLHGIIFNLFGDGVNGEKINDLINNVNKKDMVVELELLANDVPYKIVRSRKPNKLEIFEDDSITPKPSISSKIDDNYIIDTILGGIDKNTFLKLFTIQANNADISIFRMNAGERRKLLENLFDLTIYTEMKQRNSDEMSELEIDKLNINKNIINSSTNLNTQINNVTSTDKFIDSLTTRLTNDIKVLKLKENEKKEFDTKVVKELEKLSKDLSLLINNKIKINFVILKKNKEQFKKQKDEINKIILTVDSAVDNITKYAKDLKEDTVKLKEIQLKLLSLDKLELNKKNKILFEENIKIARNEISSIDTKFKMEKEFLLNIGECAQGNKEFLDCVKKKFGNEKFDQDKWKKDIKPRLLKEIIEKEISVKSIEKLINEHNINNNSFKMLEKSIAKLSKDIMDSIKILTNVGNIKKKINISNYIETWINKKENYNKNILDLEKDIFKIDIDIENYNSLLKDIKILETTINDKNKVNSDNITRDIEIIIKGNEKTKIDIEINKKELIESKKKITKIKNDLKKDDIKVKKLDEDIKIKEELSKFLKEEKIKFYIIKQSFPILKKEFNKILKRFFYGEMRVSIDNNFDIEVFRNGELQNFDSFSEGEKKRLDLGFVFTVHEFLSQKNQLSVNLLIMDELLDSALDSAGTETILEYLNEIKLTRNIVLVTHRAENIEHDRRFIISKDRKFSIIEEV